MSGDERAERLRQRRKEQKEKIESKSTDTSKPSKTSKQAKQSKKSKTVKEEYESVYMYLPEDIKKDLSYKFKKLDAEFEFEFDEGLEKNRDFYSLVVKIGLDNLEDMDVQEIKQRLDML